MLLIMRFYDAVTEDTINEERLEAFLQQGATKQRIPDFIDYSKEHEVGEQVEKEIPAEDPGQRETENQSTPKEQISTKQKIGRCIMVLLVLLNAILFVELATNHLSLYYIRYLFVGMILLIIVTICCMQKEDMKEYFERTAQEPEQTTHTAEQQLHNHNGDAVGETTLLVESREDMVREIVVEDQPKEWYLREMKNGQYPDIRLQNGTVVVGCMAEGCTYLLKERGVSRLHAKIMEKADGIYLLDLNSTNGTFLNGEMIEPGRDYKIEEGDMVAFANCEFVIVTSLLN